MAQQVGLIGLAVMGQNLVLNIESKGFPVAVYNRTGEKTPPVRGGAGGRQEYRACYSWRSSPVRWTGRARSC